jgi:lysophospholipase L1-like esterase
MNLFPEAPVLLVNEPMFISSGANSEIRYNFYYPRWAYEDYRQILSDLAVENNWHYLDLWNIVPAAEFTNSAIHMTPVGTAQLADRVAQALIELTGTNP